MSTTLRGVFVESLGGFLVVRGFAKLSDLARLSKAADYQREIRISHRHFNALIGANQTGHQSW